MISRCNGGNKNVKRGVTRSTVTQTQVFKLVLLYMVIFLTMFGWFLESEICDCGNILTCSVTLHIWVIRQTPGASGHGVTFLKLVWFELVEGACRLCERLSPAPVRTISLFLSMVTQGNLNPLPDIGTAWMVSCDWDSVGEDQWFS